MRVRFNSTSFAIAVFLLAILVLLATLGQSLGWVRSFFGDVLAVAWVFFSIRAFVRASRMLVAFVAFATGTTLEFVQYLLTSLGIEMPNRMLRIVFGATPDWWDVLAYALGALLVLGLTRRSTDA